MHAPGQRRDAGGVEPSAGAVPFRGVDRTGRLDQIQDYCRCDVLDTFFVFLRSRVLVGQLTIEREQGISKAGNPRAREKAIEMAWLWLRHQPDSALTRWFKLRTINAGKRMKRIAIVALARKLVVALWRYLNCGLVPEGAVIA